jgi:hypothetical protein
MSWKGISEYLLDSALRCVIHKKVPLLKVEVNGSGKGGAEGEKGTFWKGKRGHSEYPWLPHVTMRLALDDEQIC